jgi:hypothetical protein
MMSQLKLNIKGAMASPCEETEIKYPNSSKCARKLLLPFPSSYLAECGFSVINDLLLKEKKKERNQLDITMGRLETEANTSGI